MEQKKTLWIIAAVGLFLAVIIGTACIIYTPSAQSTPTITSISPFEKSTTDKSGWTNSANTGLIDYSNEPAPATTQLQSPSVSEMVVLSDNTTVYTTPQYQDDTTTTIDLNVLKNELAAELKPETKNQNQNINITVNVSDSSSAAVNTNSEKQIENRRTDPRNFDDRRAVPEKDVRETPKQVAQIQPPAPVKETVKVEKKTTASVPNNTSAVKASATVKTEVKKTAPEPKKVTQYWVQVGSYSSKKTAEVARSALDENKIPSDIFTYKDTKDNLYFRVRVGPYTTKSEAEYWRTRIAKINDFAKAESYVVSTTN